MSSSTKGPVETGEKTGNSSSHINKTNVPPLINSRIDRIYFLQRTVGNREVGRLLISGLIQAKLTIGQAGDAYEQEADRVSEQVMSMPETQLQGACACGGKCPECQKGQPGHTHERLQMKRLGSGDLRQTAAPPIVHDVLRSSGQPLDTATRSLMEQRFGHDFSRVRVHTGVQAAASARAVDALAYTVGRDVVFSEGRYTPQLRQGSKLLAHELAHVIQQERGGTSPPALSGGTLEQAADAAASAFAATRGPIHVGAASGPGLARQPLLASLDPKSLREPRSLRESLDLDPEQTKDWQLKEEIELIEKWLDANPIKPESDQLRKELERLQAEEWRREGEARVRTEEKVPATKAEPAPGSTKQSNSPASQRVGRTQEELDGSSRGKVLLSQILAVARLDLLKPWALELKDIHHRKSGNYLLLFFEQLRDLSPAATDYFIKMLATKGVMVDEISLAWELHKLVAEEQAERLKVDLQNYPIYGWKVALGQVAKPVVDAVNLIIHFVPVLGQAISGLEAIAGQEILTGRKLEGWERLLGILPYAGTILKAGKEGARAILVIARQTGWTPDAALKLIRNTGALSADADRFREIKKIVDQGGQLSAEHRRTLRAAQNALKPFEKEAGIASTATQRPAASAGAIKQETKAIEVTPAPARTARPGTSAGQVGQEVGKAAKGAHGIEEEAIKTGKLADYSFTHRGHTYQILKDGRIARCSKLCTFTSLEEEFGDLIGRHSHLNDAMAKLKKMTGAAATKEAENLGKRMDEINKAEQMSLKQMERLLDKPEYAKGTPIGNDIRFVHYQKTGGNLKFEAWISLDWEKPLIQRALGLLPKAGVKTFPYLRRVMDLGRNKDIAKAVNALNEAEAAEITLLMKGVESGRLDAASASRLNALMVKVEGNLAGSAPGLRVIGRMKEHDRLRRAAENLGEAMQREADDLIEHYLRGNTNPGIGTKHLAGDIFYLRGRNGARVFYRENAEGYMEILAKTDKGEEASVIKAVQAYFGS